MHDLIIVGGGPAGLTAAVYAIRKRLNALLISRDLGGKINYRMELPDIETHQVIRGVDVVEAFWRELEYGPRQDRRDSAQHEVHPFPAGRRRGH